MYHQLLFYSVPVIVVVVCIVGKYLMYTALWFWYYFLVLYLKPTNLFGLWFQRRLLSNQRAAAYAFVISFSILCNNFFQCCFITVSKFSTAYYQYSDIISRIEFRISLSTRRSFSDLWNHRSQFCVFASVSGDRTNYRYGAADDL